MIAKQTKIINKTGLHARPASDFAVAAKRFSSKVYIRNLDRADAQPVNAKSIVRILAEGMGQGAAVEISAEGVDEQEAVEALVELVETGFGEIEA